MVSHGKLIQLLPEHAHNGMRLGRHAELDSRSLEYAIESTRQRHRRPKKIDPHEWPVAIPTLDQGQLGSCTGNAGTYHLSALAGAANLGKLTLDGVTLNAGDQNNDERFAVALYSHATQDDDVPGSYPPNDTGSSGLAICKALQAAGFVSQYTWATTPEGFGQLMQLAGVIIGITWYEDFFDPDGNGFIDANANWKSSGIAGGHEIYVEALESWDAADPMASVIRFHNSWGTTWGDHGRGRMKLSTYFGLDNADCKQFTLAPFPNGPQHGSPTDSGDATDWSNWRNTTDTRIADFVQGLRRVTEGHYNGPSGSAAIVVAEEGGSDASIQPQPDYSPK